MVTPSFFEDYSEFFVWQFIDLHFSKVSYYTCIGFLWCCHACLIFFMILDSLCGYLFIWVSGLLFQTLQVPFAWEQFFTSQLSLGFWICVLVMFLGGWDLLTGSFGWDHCLSSEMAECSCAIAWELDGIAGLVLAQQFWCSGKVADELRLLQFSGQVFRWSGLGTLSLLYSAAGGAMS